jgi:GDP-L-fucose synthase
MRKFHESKLADGKEVVVWGTGTPLREFLHVDDLASGVVYCLDHYNGSEPINCGAGSEVSISELAQVVGEAVEFRGHIVFDKTKPDGTPRKLMDSSRLRALGWTPTIRLRDGIASTYSWFLKNKASPIDVAQPSACA